MALIKKLLNKLNGLHYSQEYLCLSKETLQDPLHVYLADSGHVVKDITESHVFVGYSPLIFAVPSSVAHDKPDKIDLVFSLKPFQPNEFPGKKDAIARLSLKKIYQFQDNRGDILFYEGVAGTHRFISRFHQSIIQLNNKLYNKKPGNVFLEGNLYKQVQIAYSLPRKICLITVGDNNLYNHFPTDLHGKITDQRYIISLRHHGQACRQVESCKKIVLSDMPAAAYKKVYSLGKNHMQPLKEITQFDFDSARSKCFTLPLPKDLVSYKELELVSSFLNGIHKILLFKIIYEESPNTKAGTLSHVHNCYATWRYHQKLPSNFLLR
jgi:hypothetical protein